jgi:hypothetical protein
VALPGGIRARFVWGLLRGVSAGPAR